jgi:hypothetical protein
MDREMIERHLVLAERHVTLGAMHVDTQRAIVADLEAKGHDTQRARELLRTFEEMQAMHEADRERIAGELAAATEGSAVMERPAEYAGEMGLFTADELGGRVLRGLTVEETGWYLAHIEPSSIHSDADRARFLVLHDRHERARMAALAAETDLRGNPTRRSPECNSRRTSFARLRWANSSRVGRSTLVASCSPDD